MYEFTCRTVLYSFGGVIPKVHSFIKMNPLFGILCTPGLLNQVVSYFAATLYISQSLYLLLDVGITFVTVGFCFLLENVSS